MTIPSISSAGNSFAPEGSFGAMPSSLEGLFASLLGGLTAPAEGGFSNLSGFPQGNLSPDMAAMFPTEGAVSFESLLSALGAESSTLDLQSLTQGKAFSDDQFQQFFAQAEAGQVVVQDIIVEIQVAVSEFRATGIDTSGIQTTGDLARAYELMGLSAEEAQAKADRVDEAIKLMQKLLGIETPEGAAEGGDDALAALFATQQHQVKQQDVITFSSTQTHIKVQNTVAAFSISQNLTAGDVPLNVMKGAPLTQTPLATEAALANIANPLVAEEVPLLGEKSMFANKGQKLALETMPSEGEATARQLHAEKAVGEAQKQVFANDARQSVATKVAPQETVVAPAVATLDAAQVEKEIRSTKFGSRLGSKVEHSHENTLAGTKVLFDVKVASNGELQVVQPTVTAEANAEAEASAEELLDGLQKQGQVQQRNVVERGSHFATLARQSSVAGQVNVQIRDLAKAGGGEVKILLNPPELGEMEIRLEISKGTVKGTIITQNAEVAEHLARDLRSLQQGLADAGLELQSEGIQFLLKDDQSEGQQGEGGQQHRGESSLASADEAEGEEEVTTWINPDALVDVNI